MSISTWIFERRRHAGAVVKVKRPVLPPVYLLGTLLLMIALWVCSPGPRVIAVPWNLFGVALAVLGLGLNVIGDRQFQRAKTTMNPFGKPRVLVTAGVFRYSRHPMYLGMVLLTIGLAIFIGYATPFAGAALWAVLNYRFIPHEEHTLSASFGQQYERYRTSTRRWL